MTDEHITVNELFDEPPTLFDNPDLIPPGVAAEIAGVSRQTIDEWRKSGLITKMGYGRSMAYRERRPGTLYSAEEVAKVAGERGTRIVQRPK